MAAQQAGGPPRPPHRDRGRRPAEGRERPATNPVSSPSYRRRLPPGHAGAKHHTPSDPPARPGKEPPPARSWQGLTGPGPRPRYRSGDRARPKGSGRGVVLAWGDSPGGLVCVVLWDQGGGPPFAPPDEPTAAARRERAVVAVPFHSKSAVALPLAPTPPRARSRRRRRRDAPGSRVRAKGPREAPPARTEPRPKAGGRARSSSRGGGNPRTLPSPPAVQSPA